ncbi:Predicted protein [Pustulibacterium marinum]|uniref:Uncharacterized protein n=1 Tax=Pustulibacterium marinum TaxID=1224947 RepID=A0A1I7IMH4_9FLAO|nr:DUF2271 domain-containing protein [Pustulibacterium marinum]SFU74125.1 Predicted protein [Pustulibacterium marinum]
MKLNIAISIFVSLVCLSFTSEPFQEKELTVKCLVQTKKYAGEGAYIAISLVDEAGNYQKTLYVIGDEERWYDSLVNWYTSIGKDSDVDAISGATITPGDRSVIAFKIAQTYVDKGYSIQVESAVEHNKYYENELRIPLTTENLNGSHEGTGYLRYVRFIMH